jgi:hypothetical protein
MLLLGRLRALNDLIEELLSGIHAELVLGNP